ncbi:MAG: oligosaccharide flippase family protein, partial [Leptothrix sp. (in: b-proteobacteria)]
DSAAAPAEPPRAGLRDRVRRGGFWSLVGYAASFVIRLASNLLLTRLLPQDLFGTANLGQTLLSAMAMFTDIGLRPFLVQSSQGERPEVMDTLWTIQILRGFGIGIMTLVLATGLWALQHFGVISAATAFGDGRLPLFVAVLAVVPCIGGFESTRTAEAQRTLHIRPLMVSNLSSQLISTAVLLLVAYLTHSLWSMLLAGVVSALSSVALSHFYLRGHSNRLHIDRDIVGTLKAFSRWIMLSSIVGYFANSMDKLVLGAMSSSRTLAIYSVAATAATLLTDALGKLLGDVALPAFSEIARDRPADLRRAHYRFRMPLEVAAWLCAGALMAAGPALIGLLYDRRYAEAGPMLQLLALSIPALRYRVTTALLLATGDSRVQFRQAAASALVAAISAVIGYSVAGVQGFLVGISLAPWLASSASIHRAHTLGLIDWFGEIRLLPLLLVGYAAGVGGAQLLAVTLKSGLRV